MLTKIVRAVARPTSMLTCILRRTPGISLETKVALDLYDRPGYAYGIYHAARQAKALGIGELSVIEFGVARGAGLLAMERIAADVHRKIGVELSIFGFDIGEGLPRPRDYRDLPYMYCGGFYRMDKAALASRLRRAQLVLGDVRETVPPFVQRGKFPPIGFVSFDVDYYSSTVDALAIFSGADARYLPRAYSYFDDVVQEDGLYCDYTGELLAIREFNEREGRMKLAQPNGFWLTRIKPAAWNHQLYVCHRFDHPLYNVFVTPQAEHTVAHVTRRDRRHRTHRRLLYTGAQSPHLSRIGDLPAERSPAAARPAGDRRDPENRPRERAGTRD